MPKFLVEVSEDEFASWAAKLVNSGYLATDVTNEALVEMSLRLHKLESSVVEIKE